MPPTTVHVAIAGLIACALLQHHFDTKAILLVLVASAALDLDALLAVYWSGTHRAALHNLWIPIGAFALLAWDVKFRSESYVLSRWGEYGWRVGWVTIVAVTFGHILLDAFYNGVNLFWPIHDQLYDFSGELLVSDQRGFVQDVIDLGDDGTTQRGGSGDVHYTTAVDPAPAPSPEEDPERVVYLAETGEHILLTVIGFAVVAYRIWEHRRGGGT
ncbi:membrane-bound metal-dependent hydrolase [Halalkaliarchaeum desulfuricum]|uniref:Membrane-bound metal-dependent hydrolase n=1 Tax=Halalkaliarchaeum desulfuricum TaxID=2055893 RepID=A0A343TF77_9EURY|nr:metal-dependent hydrolase [Halalkaliarchaeum desulfuricum]AUX07749.1 membrane-bound metal-dependent hydrolase [Halalkaliarchaeum desulfuricum]